MRVDPIVRLQQAAQSLGIGPADLLAAAECAACSSVALPSTAPGAVVLKVEHEPSCPELARLGAGTHPLVFADRNGDAILVEIAALDGTSQPAETLAGRAAKVAEHFGIAPGELVDALACSRCESTLALGGDDRIAFRVVHEQGCRLYPAIAGRRANVVEVNGVRAGELGVDNIRGDR